MKPCKLLLRSFTLMAASFMFLAIFWPAVSSAAPFLERFSLDDADPSSSRGPFPPINNVQIGSLTIQNVSSAQVTTLLIAKQLLTGTNCINGPFSTSIGPFSLDLQALQTLHLAFPIPAVMPTFPATGPWCLTAVGAVLTGGPAFSVTVIVVGIM